MTENYSSSGNEDFTWSASTQSSSGTGERRSKASYNTIESLGGHSQVVISGPQANYQSTDDNEATTTTYDDYDEVQTLAGITESGQPSGGASNNHVTGTRNQVSWRTTTETINGQTTQNPTSSGSSSSYDTQQLSAGFYPGNYHGKQVEWPESGLPPSPFEDNEGSAPRNYDTDGDGALDAFELLSMRWDQTKQVVTTLVQSKMEQMLTDAKSGNGINLAAEATGINARISSAKKGLETAAKALETLRNDGLSGLYMHGGAALGNMIGVGQFANAWEGRLEDGTRLHGSARWMDGVLGVVNIGLTVYPGTSAIKNGITAAMAAKTMLNGMGKTTWKNFASATATAYCKITAGECFTGDTIVITGARSQVLIATADASGIDGLEWIVSATGLVLVSRLARRRSKQDDELTHTEPTRREWSPLDHDDSGEGFVSGLSFPRTRESSMQGDVEVDKLTHSQRKSTSKSSNANARSTGSCDGLPQWAPLVCAANTTISFNGYPLDHSKIPAASAQTDAESIDDIEIEPDHPCHEELAAALEAALQADMVGAEPAFRRAHFPVKSIASHSKVVDSPMRGMSPDAKAVRSRQRSSIAWSVVSAVSLMVAACCFTNGLPFVSSLWQGEAQAKTAITKPTEELIGVKIRDLRPGQRILARVRGTDSVLPDTEIIPADWRLITLLMPKPGGDRIDIQLLRSLDWIEDAGAADGETIELNLEELGAAGTALVVSIQPCPPIEPDDGQGRRVITGTFRHSSANILALRIAGEPKPIRTTGYHPFWSEDRRDFVPAKTLETGERLFTASGTATTVLAINRQAGTEPVYNLEIDVDHVYHVGASGVLVHNSCTYQLRRALNQPKGGGAAHHIVPVNATFPGSEEARMILRKAGISLDSHWNGVMLPKATHNGIHTHRYYTNVATELKSAWKMSRSPDGVIEALDRIKQRLIDGDATLWQ